MYVLYSGGVRPMIAKHAGRNRKNGSFVLPDFIS